MKSCSNKRFEIACYRNKVLDFRRGLESDISEVLQTDRIFTNVSKGQFAKKADLQKAFPQVSLSSSNKDNDSFMAVNYEQEIAKIILQKGTMQITELERQQLLEQTIAQITHWIVNHCINPHTQRPYTTTQIQQALKQYNTSALQISNTIATGTIFTNNNDASPSNGDTATTTTGGGTGPNHDSTTTGGGGVVDSNIKKKQYLDALKYLKTVIPIERAKMELALHYPTFLHDTLVNDFLADKAHSVVRITRSGDNKEIDHAELQTTLVIQVDPSLYREINTYFAQLNDKHSSSTSGGKCRVEVLQQIVRNEAQQGDVDLEVELYNRKQLEQTQQTPIDDGPNTNEDPINETDQGRKKHKKKKKKKGRFVQDDDDRQQDLIEKLQAVKLQSKGPDLSSSSEDEDEGDADRQEEQVRPIVEATRQDEDEEEEEDLSLFGQAPRNRKNQRKAQKKKNKAKRRQQQFDQEEEDGDEDDNSTSDAPVQTEAEAVSVSPTTATATPSASAKSCNTCGGSFPTAAEYRSHFRSDWHRFNQKLKVKGLPPVSEREFQLCDEESFFGSGGGGNKDDDLLAI